MMKDGTYCSGCVPAAQVLLLTPSPPTQLFFGAISLFN